MSQQLTPQAVEEIFLGCLFRDGEDTSNAIIVEGVGSNFGLHPDRVRAHREDVRALLAQLPAQFHAGTGDGWSFLNGCTDNEGRLPRPRSRGPHPGSQQPATRINPKPARASTKVLETSTKPPEASSSCRDRPPAPKSQLPRGHPKPPVPGTRSKFLDPTRAD